MCNTNLKCIKRKNYIFWVSNFNIHMRREIIIKKSLYAGYIPNEITALSQVIFVNIIYELLIRLMSLYLSTIIRLRYRYLYVRVYLLIIFSFILYLFLMNDWRKNNSVLLDGKEELMSHYNNCIYQFFIQSAFFNSSPINA